MSAFQGQMSGGSGNNQQNAPDPTKLTIRIQGHAGSFTVDRQTAMNNSLFFEAAMSGPWANAQTGVIVLQNTDFATPETVGLLKNYLDYLEEIANEVEDAYDPLNDLDEFGRLAYFWLLGDFLSSEQITNAIMEEFENRVDDFEEFDQDEFMDWWTVLKDQPSFKELRDVMLALFVVSERFRVKERRHAIMRALPADAQEAIVDELMRQRENTGLDFQDSVVAADFYKTYARSGL